MKLKSWRSAISGLIVPVVLIALWQTASTREWVNPPCFTVARRGGAALITYLLPQNAVRWTGDVVVRLGDFG